MWPVLLLQVVANPETGRKLLFGLHSVKWLMNQTLASPVMTRDSPPSQAMQLHQASELKRSVGQEHRDNVQTWTGIGNDIQAGTNMLVCNRMDHSRV
jgi:hypothetical protein